MCLTAGCYASTKENDCRAYVAYREASGGSVETIRAVLDVVENRMKLYNKTFCQVVKQKGQFPYVRHGIRKVNDEKFLHKYRKAVIMKPVLTSSYIFFNTKKHKWGKDCRKIEKMYYCK